MQILGYRVDSPHQVRPYFFAHIESAQEVNNYIKKSSLTPLVAASEVDKWKAAILDKLIMWGIYTVEHDSDPQKAIVDLLNYETSVALDPTVSTEAKALQDQVPEGYVSTESVEQLTNEVGYTLEALVNRCNDDADMSNEAEVIVAETVLERFYKSRDMQTTFLKSEDNRLIAALDFLVILLDDGWTYPDAHAKAAFIWNVDGEALSEAYNHRIKGK